MFSKSAKLAAETTAESAGTAKSVEKPSFSKKENAERLAKKRQALKLAFDLNSMNNGFTEESFTDDEVKEIFAMIAPEDVDLFLSDAETELNGLGSKKIDNVPDFIEADSGVTKIRATLGDIVTRAQSINLQKQS